jgi:hypothetical protein
MADQAPSTYNTVMGNTIGVLWRAATGTVDPWTKANAVASAYQDGVASQGPNATPQQVDAAGQASANQYQDTLTGLGADPSQAMTGAKSSIEKALIWIAVFAIIGLAVFGFSFGAGQRA